MNRFVNTEWLTMKMMTMMMITTMKSTCVYTRIYMRVKYRQQNLQGKKKWDVGT